MLHKIIATPIKAKQTLDKRKTEEITDIVRGHMTEMPLDTLRLPYLYYLYDYK